MKNRLLITLALGILGAVLAAGAVSAQSGVGDVSVDLPGGANKALPACSNGVDDDGDGAVDLEDAGCSGPLDTDESNPKPSPPPTTPTTPTTPTPPEPPSGGGEQPPTGGGGDGGGEKPPSKVDKPFPGDRGDGGKGNGGGNGGGGGGNGGKGNGGNNQGSNGGSREPDKPPAMRKPGGAPTNSNPTTTVAPFGPAPIGVPNFIIDRFTIPPFLLPIYQACGTEYGIPWQVLASINRIETAFGTNLNVSTAGAVGWMQFLPSTWRMYGVDANRDGRKDPYNPVDAICGAANYLNASGGEKDLRTAIFAYNHADWYVDEVLLYAKQYGKLPSGIVDSLTGLTEGAHFPVAAKARYADDISERLAKRRSTPQKGSQGNVADVVGDSPTRRGIDIFAKPEAPVVAVNDGVIKRIGKTKRLGKFIVLKDAYGNQYTYANLGEHAKAIPVPKERKLTSSDFDIVKADGKKKKSKGSSDKASKGGPENTEDSRERLFAYPERPANRQRADLTGQLDEMLNKGLPGYETFKAYFTGVLEFDSKTMEAQPLRRGSRVVAGTVLGRVGNDDDGVASHVNFAIEPAGRGSKKIDPKPILDGWKLLEATAIYRAAGKNPFNNRASIGEILLMSKGQLQQRVLKNPQIEIYSCGRQDIRTGQVDRRILATLEYIAQRGFRPTVTSLKCGHGVYTTSGNVSHHASGNAVDIAQINGVPILGNQGRGSITEAVIQDMLKLQGTMQPAQIISLMEIGGPTFAMGDHADHIHVGFTPAGGTDTKGGRYSASLLEPGQWDKLLDRIGQLDQPEVPVKPSRFSLPGKKKRSSNAHLGE